ncbi:MAG: FTR1 family protein [Chloroflexota bacterium]
MKKPLTNFRPFLSILLGCVLLAVHVSPARARALPPAETAERLRTALVTAQLALASDPPAALAFVHEAQESYAVSFAPAMAVSAPQAHRRVTEGFARMAQALHPVDAAGFALARAQAWTALLAGAMRMVEASLQQGDFVAARAWLAVREFRTATRFSRPGADATLAVVRATKGEMPVSDALLSVRADLLDTYQARLDEALRDAQSAAQNGFLARRAELAGLSAGYFAILAPVYAEQRGADALVEANRAFDSLVLASQTGEGFSATFDAVHAALEGFRAAPLSPAEQARRAGQLLRFLSLVPIEYERGVEDGRVIHDFEIQEAITFYEAASAAFADLKDLFPSTVAAQSAVQFDSLGLQLAQAGRGASVADPGDVRSAASSLAVSLERAMPAAWLAKSTQGDFEVLAALLDGLETAIRAGDYDQAESARLEAYAVMETGPEARLLVLAPQLTPEIENLFWNGQDEHKGLAYLIKTRAPLRAVQASRARLDALLADAEQVLGQQSSPLAVAANAVVIVFREGMEAMVILASLMSSMRRPEERKYRRPMWWGALAAFAATLATWMLARGVLQALARYGEKLEAIVSLLAVGMLLLIMNWFFHKVYWTNWIAQFHSRKRQLLSGEAGLVLGLIVLGFTSVYREGFEVVLFLQALVLEAGSAVVLTGTAAGLLLVLLLGVITFRLQVNLPYRKMLIVTGIMIGAVLLQIVGKTVYTMQVVGWMPIHTLPGVSFPYAWGAWFGLYPTWEGLLLQFLAAGFVIGSYYLAEWAQKRKRQHVLA